MSQILDRVDPTVVTENIRKAWNGWNYQQKTMWCLFHELPTMSHSDFDDLTPEIQDALFCEYLDNAKRHLE